MFEIGYKLHTGWLHFQKLNSGVAASAQCQHWRVMPISNVMLVSFLDTSVNEILEWVFFCLLFGILSPRKILNFYKVKPLCILNLLHYQLLSSVVCSKNFFQLPTSPHFNVLMLKTRCFTLASCY